MRKREQAHREREEDTYAAEEGQDGAAGVAADDGDVDGLDVEALALGDKGARPDNVERGDAKDLVLVVLAHLLELLGRNRDRRVDGVADDQHNGLRAEPAPRRGPAE